MKFVCVHKKFESTTTSREKNVKTSTDGRWLPNNPKATMSGKQTACMRSSLQGRRPKHLWRQGNTRDRSTIVITKTVLPISLLSSSATASSLYSSNTVSTESVENEQYTINEAAVESLLNRGRIEQEFTILPESSETSLEDSDFPPCDETATVLTSDDKAIFHSMLWEQAMKSLGYNQKLSDVLETCEDWRFTLHVCESVCFLRFIVWVVIVPVKCKHFIC